MTVGLEPKVALIFTGIEQHRACRLLCVSRLDHFWLGQLELELILFHGQFCCTKLHRLHTHPSFVAQLVDHATRGANGFLEL